MSSNPTRLVRRALPAAFALASITACAAPAPVVTPSPTAASNPADAQPDARQSLVALIDSLVTAPEWRNSHWGILIVDPRRGDTLYSVNAGKLFMPASNQKLLTGAVALARLGPDYRFRTEVGSVNREGTGRAPISDGTLHGDLVITGYGDPTISDHARGDAMLPLLEIADSLEARGIRRISGHLVAGADNLPGPELGFGWAWDDLDYPYSAGVDELYFNEGFTRITLHGGARAGDPVRVSTAPARSYPSIQLAATTVDRTDSLAPRAQAETAPDGRGVIVTGAVRAGDSTVIEFSFRNHTAAYMAALREALASRGVVVEGTDGAAATRVTAPPGAPLFTMFSPPLREIMPLLQKPSQNQIAELLMRTVGRELTGNGSADSGRAVIERQLMAWGAQPDGFVIRDGSGLSRHDYVTPSTIITVLDVMTRDPAFAIYYDALPIAGVDGTIAGRMKGTPAQGNVHAKTGYIDRARSLSGYVTTLDGQHLLFSILANNWTTSVRAVERVQDAIAARLAGMTLGGSTAVGGR